VDKGAPSNAGPAGQAPAPPVDDVVAAPVLALDVALDVELELDAAPPAPFESSPEQPTRPSKGRSHAGATSLCMVW
jgi:hypothetical protein